MREIAIERYQYVVSVLMRPANTIAVGASNAKFSRAMNSMDTRIFDAQAINNRSCPVGRIIVKKEKVGREPERPNSLIERFDVFRFIVGRDENQAPKAVHVCPSSAATMIRTISSNGTRGRQPVAAWSFSARPQSGLAALHPSRTSLRTTTCSRQSTPTAENASSRNSRTE